MYVMTLHCQYIIHVELVLLYIVFINKSTCCLPTFTDLLSSTHSLTVATHSKLSLYLLHAALDWCGVQ